MTRHPTCKCGHSFTSHDHGGFGACQSGYPFFKHGRCACTTFRPRRKRNPNIVQHAVRVEQTEPGGSWVARCTDCHFEEYASTRAVARVEREFHRNATEEYR